MQPEQAKQAVMERVRASLRVGAEEKERRRAVRERLGSHPRNTIPARGQTTGPARLELFGEMLAGQGADVIRATSPADVVHAIAQYLTSRGLPLSLRMGLEPVLAALPWSLAPSIIRAAGPVEASDTTGLSRAILGVAETGTLFFVSGADSPALLNFLPETSIVLLGGGDVVASYEDGFDLLRSLYGEATLPRSVNWISGPSRTADIEQTIVRGAHGPKRLAVILLDQG